MPRTFNTNVMCPAFPPGEHGAIGDICVAGDGQRYVKQGSGDTDWRLETPADIGGGPYRTAQEPSHVESAVSDPHRSWLIKNADWPYIEMDWSDRFEVPIRVQWAVQTGAEPLVVELRTNAMPDQTGNTLRVFKSVPSAGVRRISVFQRTSSREWRPNADGVWTTPYRTEEFSKNGKAIPVGAAMREEAEISARSFLQAYEEIVRRRSS